MTIRRSIEALLFITIAKGYRKTLVLRAISVICELSMQADGKCEPAIIEEPGGHSSCLIPD
jgi:hypothetical protein